MNPRVCERKSDGPVCGEHVLEVVQALERAHLAVWIDGGWGVDAVLGTQTRDHHDVDLVVELSARSRNGRRAIRRRGHGRSPTRPARVMKACAFPAGRVEVVARTALDQYRPRR